MDTDIRTPAPPPGEHETASPASTRRSRLLASVFIVVTLFAIGASTMPDSVLKKEALGVALPYLGATGLDQDWGVFAPDPRTFTSFVSTRIDRADGTSVTIPHPAASGLTDYWDYRWRTFLTQLAPKSQEADRLAYARWIADQDRGEGHDPVRVSLIRRSAALQPPGPGPDQGPWNEQVLLSLEVAR